MWFSRHTVSTLLRRNRILSLGEEVKLSRRLFAQDCVSVKINDETSNEPTGKVQTKVLKVAFIGRPNSGKSTLINQIAGRTVSAVSCKAHTTRVKIQGTYNHEDTQIVFLDTPGLVYPKEVEKFKFDPKFLRSAEEAVHEADILGILFDVSSVSSELRINTIQSRLLLLYQFKKSFLVLNKVDAVKKKDSILEMIKSLTCYPKHPIKDLSKSTEHEVQKCATGITSWPHFSEVFIISALEGDGVGDVKEYLLNQAQPGPWLITGPKVLDPKVLAVDLVRASACDYLIQEIPYKLQYRLNFFEDHGDKCAVEVSIICSCARYQRAVLNKVRKIASYAEHHLNSAMEKECRLTINVQHVPK